MADRVHVSHLRFRSDKRREDEIVVEEQLFLCSRAPASEINSVVNGAEELKVIVITSQESNDKNILEYDLKRKLEAL